MLVNFFPIYMVISDIPVELHVIAPENPNQGQSIIQSYLACSYLYSLCLDLDHRLGSHPSCGYRVYHIRCSAGNKRF